MFGKLAISIVIASMLIIPLVPGNASGEKTEDYSEILDLSPEWKDFSRDTDSNGVDDLIDEENSDNNSIIVVFNEPPTETDVGNVESLGLDVWYRSKYTNTLLVNDVSQKQVNILRFVKGVSMVEINPEMKPMLDHSTKGIKARPTDLGEDGVKYHDVWEELGYNGTGINIAILDTGVDDPDHESLDDMDDNILTIDPKFIAGWTYPLGGTSVNPHDFGPTGHGTHCAGIALGTGGASGTYSGVAPGSRLVDVKTLSDAGVGGFIVPAMEWCIDNNDTDWLNDGPGNDGIQVMSMSLGGPDSNGDDTISITADEATAAGIVVVAAMGNDGAHRVSTPAAADTAIAVAASDDQNTVDRSDDTHASYSNHGPRGDGELKPDVTATGTQVMSATKDTWQAYHNFDGTSMATPHVAGVVALMLQANPELTPARVKKIVRLTAEEKGNNHIDPSEPKYDTHWGWGLTDAYAAVNLALGMPDLKPISLEATSDDIDEGEEMELRATIVELNDRDVEADVVFRDDTGDSVIRTIPVELDASETKTIYSDNFTAKGGDRTFRVEIENAEPAEDDISNNQLTESLHVNYLPEPNIEANRTTVKTSEEIEFSGSKSSDRDGTVEMYHFDFGDGNETEWEEENSTIHSFSDDGEYNVTLNVRDDKDAESKEPAVITITVENRPPTAGAGSNRTAIENEEVEFQGTGNDEDGDIVFYEWDFVNDGNFSWNSTENGETTHTYQEKGNYTAVLRVTDDDGDTDTDEREIEVLPEGTINNPPVSIITEPGDGETFQEEDIITFDGRDSFDPDSDELIYSWTDNGHEFSTKKYFSTSLDTGEHTIVLQVDDSRGGVDSSQVDITVNSPPIASIDSPEDGGTYYTDEEISFDASDSYDPDDDQLSFQWKDNGELLSNEEQFSEKLDEGEHKIELTVDDGNGADDLKVINITVEIPDNRAPVAVITSPEDGQTFRDFEEITFDGTDSYDPDDDSITFYWYDNSYSMDNYHDREFTTNLTSGEHEIKLIVEDPLEETGEHTINIHVKANNDPVARITSPKDGESYPEGTSLNFDATQSTDQDEDELSFTWKDNGNQISTSEKFSKVLSSGTHDIELIVEDDHGGWSNKSITIRINKVPNSIIRSPADGDVFYSDQGIFFDASDSFDEDGKIVSYIWKDNGEKIGEGKTLEQAIDTGSHNIELIVKDNDGGKSVSEISLKSVEHSIDVSVQEEFIEVNEGEEAEFHIKIKNLAELEDEIRLSSDESVEFSKKYFVLQPNEEQTVTMKVSSNYDTDIHLTVWAGQFPFYTTAKIKIAPESGVSMISSTDALTGNPGTSLNFVLVITNTGTGDDRVSVSYNSSKTWSVKLDKTNIEILPGTSDQVILTVKLPKDAVKGQSMAVEVTATTQDGTESSTLSLTATVDEETTTNNPGKDDDDDGLPGFEAAILLTVVLSMARVYSYDKRKKKAN